MPVDKLRRQLGMRFFSTRYNTWPGVGLLARKNRLVMTWYSLLGINNFLNAIVSHLIALKTLKPKHFLGFAHWKPNTSLLQTPSYTYDQFAIGFFLKLSMVTPCLVVRDRAGIFRKNLFIPKMGRMGQKWAKNRVFWIYWKI